MAVTEHRGYPLPIDTAKVKEEFLRLRDETLPQIDLDVHELFLALVDKASADHGHEIGNIVGLVAALADKMPVNKIFRLEELLDVVGADAAPDGYVLVKVGDDWVAQAAAAAIGTHGHQIGQVAGLEDILLDIASDLSDRYTKTQVDALIANALASIPTPDVWASQPMGIPIGMMTNLGGSTAPPTNKAYRYVKLTASDAYNTGILTGETISGSSPDIIATALVSLAGSPYNGNTIPLINTDRRFLRGGSAGTKEQSQNKSHSHTGTAASAGNHRNTVPIIGSGNVGGTGGSNSVWGSTNSANNTIDTSNTGAHTHTLTINADGSTEARPASLGVDYYMRIK